MILLLQPPFPCPLFHTTKPSNFISFSPNKKPPSLKCHNNININVNNSNNVNTDIDMVQSQQGIYIPKKPQVVILWDLDNKPPKGPPYEAALSLKTVASKFGHVVEVSAYANRHAFTHLPTWVAHQRRERHHLDVLERKGIVTPNEPYICGVCGRKCRTNVELKRHFTQLHERERQKKLTRMKQLKGKKRQKFKERYIDRNGKFEEAARRFVTPKVGYGLARELRRAGVFVKTVEDKPQAADWALKRQMLHCMSRGVDWLVLVSDDSDFRDMLRKAREANLGTVVVGDEDRALGRCADLWVSWGGVESGKVKEEDLVPRRGRGAGEVDWGEEEGDGGFSVSGFGEGVEGGSDLDEIVDEVVGSRSREGVSGRFSAFSEGEEEDEEWEDDHEEEEDEYDLGDSSDYDEE